MIKRKIGVAAPKYKIGINNYTTLSNINSLVKSASVGRGVF
jgi:hypothetical protein